MPGVASSSENSVCVVRQKSVSVCQLLGHATPRCLYSPLLARCELARPALVSGCTFGTTAAIWLTLEALTYVRLAVAARRVALLPAVALLRASCETALLESEPSDMMSCA